MTEKTKTAPTNRDLHDLVGKEAQAVRARVNEAQNSVQKYATEIKDRVSKETHNLTDVLHRRHDDMHEHLSKARKHRMIQTALMVVILAAVLWSIL